MPIDPVGESRLHVLVAHKRIVNSATLSKAVAIWLLLVALAVANGALREKVLVPAFGSMTALQISGVTLATAIFFLSWLSLPWYGRLTPAGYWRVGLLWLSMTLIFELAVGRLVAHKSWSELQDAYNVAKGNLWIIVLLAVVLSPWLASKLRGHTTRDSNPGFRGR